MALGISIANALYIALSLIGVGSLLASSVHIMIGLKVAGGLFLIYLALRAKKSNYASLSAQVNVNEKQETTFFKEFIVGFMSGILNPKNILFYLSLFTVVLTKDVSLTFKIILGVWMTSLVFIWDSAIVFLLSGDNVRSTLNGKYMALKVDLKHFLDEKGNVLALTEQAKAVFKFLTTIVLSVSDKIEQRLIEIDFRCNTRANELSCEGDIEARCIANNIIEWHCDTCEASGTISNWQGSTWDRQKPTIH